MAGFTGSGKSTGEVRGDINNDSDHGSTAPHNYRTDQEIENLTILYSEGFAPGFSG